MLMLILAPIPRPMGTMDDDESWPPARRPWLMFYVELCPFFTLYFSLSLFRPSCALIELFRTVDGSPEKGGELGGKHTHRQHTHTKEKEKKVNKPRQRGGCIYTVLSIVVLLLLLYSILYNTLVSFFFLKKGVGWLFTIFVVGALFYQGEIMFILFFCKWTERYCVCIYKENEMRLTKEWSNSI